MVEALRRTFDRIFRSHTAQPQGVVDEIRAFAKLPSGWNSHRAPTPTQTAIKAAIGVVELVARRGGPMPSASPTPSGGVALVWELPALDAQLLVDEDSFDFSVARRGHPKVTDQGSVSEMYEVEKRFIDRYLIVQH